MPQTKLQKTQRRKLRVRSKIFGTKETPRLSIHRSSKHIYAQLINDEAGKTIASFSSKSKGSKVKKGQTKSETSAEIGKKIAELAKDKKVKSAVVDRGSFRYHGRLKILVEAAREGGLKI